MSHKYMMLIGFIIIFVIFLLLASSLSLASLAYHDNLIPGPYLALAFKAPLTASPTPTPTSTPTYGILLISEVMVQPGSSEPDGEWVELINTGGGVLDLSTYKLGDEETRGHGEGMLRFPVGSNLAPGQVIVIANNALNFKATYGFNPDFEMTATNPTVPDMRKVTSWASGTINLANSGDEVLVLDDADSIVDSLSWGDSSWAFYPACPAPPLGWTLERYPAFIDTNSASDWRKQSNPIPRMIDLTPPTSTPTVTPTITEISTVTSSPTSSRTITLTHTPTTTPTHSPTSIPNSTPTRTFTPSYTPTPSKTVTSTNTPTLTGTITPTTTPTPTVTPTSSWLLISEVLYDPFGIEPDGEWIELFNPGETAIDLSNYKVGDEVLPGNLEGMYQFPYGATIVSGQVIIIANRADVFTATYSFYPDYEFIETDVNVPNMTMYITWTIGLVNLANTGDEVLVLDESDHFVDAVSWGDSNWAFDPPCPVVAEGHSLERNPANVDTDTSADWIDQPVPDPGQVYFVHYRDGNIGMNGWLGHPFMPILPPSAKWGNEKGAPFHIPILQIFSELAF
jgi:hypothetical protein